MSGVFNIKDGVLESYSGDENNIVIEDGVNEIGDNAFKDCINIINVKLPDSITRIGDSAFSHCSNLKEINIPKGVKSIGEQAFAGCCSIQNITLPKSLKQIGFAVFQGCRNLENIELYDNIREIEDSAFSNCISLKSINIPAKVKKVSFKVFQNCKSLTEITVPDGVTEILGSAFRGCENLVTVNLPDSIEEIQDNIFENCISLKNVNIPSNIEKILTKTFSGCKSLEEIIIPEKVTEIGVEAFAGTSLKKITFENKNLKVYERWFNANNYHHYKNIRTLIRDIYPKQLMPGARNYVIQDVLEILSSDKNLNKDWRDEWIKCLNFCRKSLYNIIIENQYMFKLMTDEKFLDLEDVKELLEISTEKSLVEISASLLEYQNKAFTEEELNEFRMAELNPDVTSSKYLKKFWKFKKNNDYYFHSGDDDEDDDEYYMTITEYLGDDDVVTIPSIIDGYKVTRIGKHAFAWNNKITEVIIPDSVKTIEEEAFYHCKGIKSMNIPAGVCFIGEVIKDFYTTDEPPSSFIGCDNLSSFTVAEDNENFYSKDGMLCSGDYLICCPPGKKGIISIPEGIKSIEKFAFTNCSEIKVLVIPGSLKNINRYSFSHIRDINELILSDSVTEIIDDLFDQFKALSTITVSPNNKCFVSVDGILYDKELKRLIRCPNNKTEITIPESVIEIGQRAFYKCGNLNSVIIPDSVTSIEDNAFKDCHAVIHGKPGSYAESFAKQHNIPFEAV